VLFAIFGCDHSSAHFEGENATKWLEIGLGPTTSRQSANRNCYGCRASHELFSSYLSTPRL